MIITKLKAEGFRNLKNIDLSFSPGLNILYGDNGEGKTNLLELIWIMTGVKSFRGAKEREMYSFGGDRFEAEVEFEDKLRSQVLTASAFLKRPPDIKINGVPVRRFSKLFDSLRAVIFTPDDLKLASGEPSCRRAFTDLSIAQIRPAYGAVLARYNRILSQRNAALKDSRPVDTEMWDIQLSKIGSHLSLYRDVYIKMLQKAAGRIYSEISSDRETLEIRYRSNVYKDESNFTADYYLSRLASHASDDRRAGTTLVGIHRDDLLFTLDGKPVREYASQGQQRSVSLAVKLAAAKILTVEHEDPPIVLLDDVLSELDGKRRKYISENLSGFQTIITSCEEITAKGQKFHVKDGEAHPLR
ncbi:MAG: DNA replication and repair protein RecF [Ruminococcus sp.]|jgi:DNA replication and repair protein RecF|nr:DNA replication and repair protein RecF [Ruminococcus sp.]